MLATEFVEHLDGVKKTGKGWQTRCPAHDDKVASLSVDPGSDGRPLIFCHAGCSPDEIVAALKLSLTDLFVDEKEPNFFALEDAVRVYDYQDESGSLLYKVGRFIPKSFRPFRLDGGRWVLGQDGVRRVPYRLPQVLAAAKENRWVFVVEGEKDVDTLERQDLVATCNSGGAGKWDEHWGCYFPDASVAVLPDNDEPGYAHGKRVAESVYGVAKQVKIVRLPGLPEKGDVTDYLRNGGNKEKLKALVRDAPLWSPSTLDEDLVIPSVSSIKAERVEWLWPGYLPLGKLSILEGDPGLGKSTLTLDLAARLTVGGALPDGTPGIEPSNVLLFTAEDAIGDTVRPRLEAAGADLDRVYVMQGIRTSDGQRMIEFPQDVPRLEHAIKHFGARFVIIDPLMAFLGSGIDSHRDQDVRRVLYPLAEMASRTGTAVLLMRHLNKGTGKVMYRGGGSIGIVGAVRLGMLVAPDPEFLSRQVLAVFKSNLAPIPDALCYRLLNDELRGVARVAWEGPSEHDASDLLDPRNKRDREGLERIYGSEEQK